MSVWVNVWGAPLARRGKLGLVAFALALSGCIDDFDDPKGYGGRPGGYDCAEVCEEYVRCDGSTSASECQSQCVDTERLVRAADCERAYDDLLDCFARADDVCSASDETCARETAVLTACVNEYCWDNIEGCSI